MHVDERSSFSVKVIVPVICVPVALVILLDIAIVTVVIWKRRNSASKRSPDDKKDTDISSSHDENSNDKEDLLNLDSNV